MCGRGWERKPPAPSPSEATLGLGTNTKKVPQLLYFYRREGRDGTECPLGGRVRRRGGGGRRRHARLRPAYGSVVEGGGNPKLTTINIYYTSSLCIYILRALSIYIYNINLALAFKFKYSKVINHQNSCCLLLNNTILEYIIYS